MIYFFILSDKAYATSY